MNNRRKYRYRKPLVMGEKWLRVLSEQPHPTLGLEMECLECGIIWPLRHDACRACGGRLEEVDWDMVNRWIRRAIRDDPQILARVEADYEGRFSQNLRIFIQGPVFSGEFEWLNSKWKDARAPRGRPFGFYKRMIVFRLAQKIKIVRPIIKEERNPAAKRKLKADLYEIEKELEKKFFDLIKNDTQYDPRYVEDAYRWGKRYMEDVKFRLKWERPGQRGAKRKKR